MDQMLCKVFYLSSGGSRWNKTFELFGRETYEEYLGEIVFDFGLAVQVER